MLNRPNSPIGVPLRRRRRFGFLTQITMLFVLGGAFMLLITAVFAPWGYYLGGHFHPLPYWQGMGRVNVASAGGEYLLFVRVEPSSSSSGMYLTTSVGGIAYLCTPKGERYRLSMGGSMDKHLPVDTLGKKIYLYMSNAPGWKTQFITDRRPSLGFYGIWSDRELPLDDHMSISKAFLPDGTLYKAHDRNHPPGKEVAHITLKESSWDDFDTACRPQAK